MKFLHLSDLHFGKIMHGYELLEEQRDLLRHIIEVAEQEEPDAIVIAGDIYDRTIPSAAAMTLLEEFFLALDSISVRKKQIEVLVIAGNHDSAQRLSYGSSFLARHHIHIAVFPPQEEGERLQKVTLQDAFGAVHFYLLPYTKPGMLRHLPGAEKIQNSNDAIRFLLQQETIDWNQRNVLISHQFYANAGREPVQCDSETPRLYVGGLDIVDVGLVKEFDYVALGHIHSPQDMGQPNIRYCGTLYPYSVSEAEQVKYITVVELEEKGKVVCRHLPVTPLRRVRRLFGTLAELTQEEKVCHEYVSITLTDEDMVERPKEYLEHFYDHILEIQVENTRTKRLLQEEAVPIGESTPFEAFQTFFLDMSGREMNEQEKERFLKILEEVEEEQE